MFLLTSVYYKPNSVYRLLDTTIICLGYKSPYTSSDSYACLSTTHTILHSCKDLAVSLQAPGIRTLGLPSGQGDRRFRFYPSLFAPLCHHRQVLPTTSLHFRGSVRTFLYICDILYITVPHTRRLSVYKG